jgi:hypothetical protein
MPQLNLIDQLTAAEVVNRSQNPDAWHIIEVEMMKNELLIDMPITEANDGTVHTTIVRNMNLDFRDSHRIYNQGVGFKATQTEVKHDRIMEIMSYSWVDKRLGEDSGNLKALRNSEAIKFVTGMGDERARCILYGNNIADPAEIDGFATRLNALPAATDRIKNVFSMGGSTAGALTSVYLVAVGPDFCHLIYPKGNSSVGVTREDLGEKMWDEVTSIGGALTGKKFQALVELFYIRFGLSIGHPEAVKRICNISTATADLTSANGELLIDKILSLSKRMPRGVANYILYANPTILDLLDYTSRNKSNVLQTREDPWGREINHIRNIRIRQVDQLLDTEDVVA